MRTHPAAPDAAPNPRSPPPPAQAVAAYQTAAKLEPDNVAVQQGLTKALMFAAREEADGRKRHAFAASAKRKEPEGARREPTVGAVAAKRERTLLSFGGEEEEDEEQEGRQQGGGGG